MNFIEKSSRAASLYLPQLDGLRLLAFLLVFAHHLPLYRTSAVLAALHLYGWVGVEMFFAISAYLFFHLFSAEAETSGRISIRRFYVRRMLRIYPLMIAFPIAMLIIYGSSDGWEGVARLAALGLFLDNFVTLFRGYNGSIPHAWHLWTLSFEFQIYFAIPFVFIAYRKFGKRAFLIGAGVLFAYCLAARLVVLACEPKTAVIWVTPFLRPESVLAGLLLHVLRPQWAWQCSAAATLLGGALFFAIASRTSTLGVVLSYPLAALMSAGLIDTALRAPWATALTSAAPVVALGRISFGLYVYHVVSIHLTRQMLPSAFSPGSDLGHYVLFGGLALAITVALSAASYLLFELRIERLKSRFAVVHGRAVAQPLFASRVALVDAPPAARVSADAS